MTKEAQRVIDLLVEATADIGIPYFALPVAYRDTPIYRERVYAYELYHQLRRRWPDGPGWPFILNGEVDKRGHEFMQGDYVTDRIPDLLVHCPGDMDGNLVIVEVKGVDASVSGTAEDLRKIDAFCGLGYKRGVLLFFGEASDPGALLGRCALAGGRAPEIDMTRIVLMWQSSANTRAAILDPPGAVQASAVQV